MTGFEPATSRPPAERATKLRHTPGTEIIIPETGKKATGKYRQKHTEKDPQIPQVLSIFYKKECALAHSRAEARLLRQPSTLAPSAHPRGAFLSYGNEVSYTIKKRHSRNCHAVFRKNLHSAGALRRRNREANVQFGSAILATL